MARRIEIDGGSATEASFGYVRAVRVGPFVSVAGTTAMGPDGPTAEGLEDQTREVLRRIAAALEQTGARLDDVVRTRIFVTDVSRWREVGAVHREVFSAHRPTTTIVEVARLFHPGLLIEVEAEAVVADERGGS